MTDCQKPNLDGSERDLEVITTHVSADFDALASMLAASRLYPGALLVLPGAQDRNLRNFFVESTCYFYNFVKVKDVPFKRVRRLIMVDTRQAGRIGPLADLLLDPEVEVHAYDHHPDSEDDVKTTRQVVEQTGATVTILSRFLREQGAELSEEEATLLALGIYEDTGSFAFVSTTPADLEAASWLLAQGANLKTVSSLIARDLSAEEVGILNDMINSSQKMAINGVEVVLSEVTRERYVPDFAVLVHKFMDMDNLDTLFALARMEGRVYLVARSRLPQVDAGMIAGALGGGGHATAASATLRDMTLVEARHRLQAVLRAHIGTGLRAGDLMTSPVVSVPLATSLDEAHEALNRYSLEALPVVDDGQVMGVITSDIVEKALHHGLGELGVGEYMDRYVETLDVGDSLGRVEEAIVARRNRLVPVTREGALAGVITTADFLESLVEHPPSPQSPDAPGGGGHRRPRQKRIAGVMRERLPKPVVAVLSELGQLAADLEYKAYLVGGSVRDLMLRRENLDLDVVVEGDAVEFARRYAENHPGVKRRSHTKFRTAKLFFPDGLDIDLATARLEYYRAPAALPVVELSSLKLDLYRRDFTINTLAVNLEPGHFGELLDFFDGLRDLKDRAIRVLHNLSFVEDPTRVFRAVRFEQRFNFRIGRFTEGLIKNALAIDAFKNLSGKRLFGELEVMLEEERALDCVRRLKDLKLLPVFHSELKIEDWDWELLENAEEALAWYRLSFLDQPIRRWLVLFLAISDGLDDKSLAELCQRLDLAPRFTNEIINMRREALEALHQMQRQQPPASLTHQLLRPLRPAYQLYIMAKAKREWVKRAVSLYMGDLARVRTALTGEDLRAMGFKPGPLYGRILERILAARLDGEVGSLDQERALVLAEFAGMREDGD